MKNEACEARISELLKQMTLEEKVGQLRQCGPSIVGAFDVSFEELLDMMFDGKISKEEFERLMSTAKQDFREEDLRAGRIGSYNGIGDAATTNRLQKIAVEETRLGIPLLFGYDVIHGFRTVTPIPLAEACSWEPELWERTARAAACEATAAGVHMTFAPMVDVAKDARWGRVCEGAGEDAMLASLYGAAKVKGFQNGNLGEKDSMAACVKHFAGYGAAEAGKDYNRVDMSMQRFYEEYLPPYEACVKAGARAVMPAFNDINGVPCSVNRWLLTDVLRDKWGFDGMTISDANAIAECVVHGIAEDKAAAAAQALAAGTDMDMSSDSYHENLAALVESGAVRETDLDRAVADVLRVKFELGLFDHPYRTDEKREQETLLKPEFRALAREAAWKSMVLLKNENVLPLRGDVRLGVVGALADSREEMVGAWAIGAHGEDCVSILDACRSRNVPFSYTAGLKECGADEKPEIDRAALLRVAEESDVLLLAIGEQKKQSGEAASRADITIAPEQRAMLSVLKETKKPVAVVLFNGRPLAMPEVEEQADAILEAWHPGVEAGSAVLDILFGDVNPSGKLTMTFPYATGQCPLYYAHINTGRPGGRAKFTSKYLDVPLTPLYPFGYGLSYTTYEYADLKLEQQKEAVVLSATVKNTGKTDGEEIVQCYVRDETAKRVRPVKQLIDFEKIALKAGEEREVRFVIPYEKLGYLDMDMNYIVEEGWFEVSVGGSSAECLTERFEL